VKRPTEVQLEFPLMTIVFDPLSMTTVVLEVQMDWGLTGEVQLKYTTLQSLKDFHRLNQFVVNHVADEIAEREKFERQERKRKEAPPF